MILLSFTMSVGWFLRFKLVLPYFPVMPMTETEATALSLLPLAVKMEFRNQLRRYR